MQIKVSDITWVTDGHEVALPETIEMTVDAIDTSLIADKLSDQYGFCVDSFTVDEA